MKYPVHVFMGSDKDLKHADIVFSELDLLGVTHTSDIVSGEKAPRDCMGRIKDYDMAGRGAYLSIVGMGNTMGPLISGVTYNPAITMPVGSKEELKFYIGSSIGRPKDSALITLIGEGEDAALFMAEIMGLHDDEVRKRVCERKGIEYKERIDRHSRFTVYHDTLSMTIPQTIMETIDGFAKDPGIFSRRGPKIVVSDFYKGKASSIYKHEASPIIATPAYGSKEIRKLRRDVERFIQTGGTPVGLVADPKNAAFAALRIMGLGNRGLSGKLREKVEKLQDQYRK
jgi:phosphoribosylaminoimidazole carboxylase PurE protein